MSVIYDDENVKTGKSVHAKLKVISVDPIFDIDTNEITKVHNVYCRNATGYYLTFPAEEFLPEVGMELSITVDWDDEL